MRLRPGDVRLVALTYDPVPGLTVHPSASQLQVRTIVLVHLRYGPLAPPHPDTNLVVDVKEARGRMDEDGDGELNVLPRAVEKQ